MGDRQRKILGAMTVAALFAIVGEGVKGELPGGSNVKKGDPFKILLGAGAATAILVGISELGDAGSQFAQGLAFMAVIVAVLEEGGPVWQALSKLVGAKGAPIPATTPTAPSVPTRAA